MAGETEEVSTEAADEAAFNSGFDTPDSPTATPDTFGAATGDKVEETPVPKADETPAVEYAQITKAEYADLMAKAASVDKAFGKIGGIERALTQLQSTGTVEVTADDFTELREEFPELAELQAKGLNKILGKLKGGANPEAVEKAVTEKVAAIRQELIDDRLDEVVGGDWQAEVKSPAYAAWIAAQPAEVKALEASSSVKDAAKLLRLFKTPAKTEPEPKPSTRKQQLEAAVTPRGTGGFTPRNTDEDEFNAGFKSG